jgi:hypothetical protein
MNPHSFAYRLRIAQDAGCGLCNQLYALSGCIDFFCEQELNRKGPIFIAVDQFLQQIGTNDTCPVGDVIDLDAFNDILAPIGVVLIGRNARLEIVKAMCDLEDITAQIAPLLLEKERGNTLYLSPFFLAGKTVSVQYRIGRGVFTATSDDAGLCIAFPDGQFKPSPQLYFGGSHTPLRFVHLLSSIPFTAPFVEQRTVKFDQVTTVIHLRLEQDAINSFSQQIAMTGAELKSRLEDTYIAIIRRHVAPNTAVLVLSGDYDNRVVRFLHDEGYKVVTTEPKPWTKRELNAVHDLLAATDTDAKTFIGVYESSYSYTVMFRLFKIKPALNAVIFHMKQLNKPEMVFTAATSVDEMRSG